MHERRRLEGITGSLVRHLVRGQFAQLLIDEGEQLTCGLGIALLNAVEDLGDVAHMANSRAPGQNVECRKQPENRAAKFAAAARTSFQVFYFWRYLITASVRERTPSFS